MIFTAVISFSVFSQEKSNSDDISAESKKQAKLEKKQLDAERKFRQKAVMDEKLNVLYAKVSSYKLKGNSLSIALKNGSFNIFSKSDSGKRTPLFSSVNSQPVKFFLKYDGTVYDLNGNPDIAREIRQTQNGAQIVFSLSGFFQIAVDLSFVSTVPEDGEDAVLMRIYSTNLSGRTRKLSVKAVFDTVLGENLPSHFSCEDGRKISTETLLNYDDLKKARYILSSDRENSVQFILYGKEISPIQNVLAANPEVMENLEWNGREKTERGFNSINLYNNSAVMITWQEKLAKANSTVSDDFYIFTAADGRMCRGEKFISDYDVAENSKTAEEKPYSMQTDLLKETAENYPRKNTEKATAETVPENGAKNGASQKDTAQEASLSSKSEKRTDVDFIVAPLDDYKIDPEYIQSLIDKIDSLQSDSENIDKEEIERLNAELDAIFKVLRRKQ